MNNTKLFEKAEIFRESLTRMINTIIKHDLCSLQDLAGIKEDELDAIRSANETIESFNLYLENHASTIDEMVEKLDKIQEQIKETNKRITDLQVLAGSKT